jgi:tetratricopeptide (TPR) repeat protein
MSRSAISAVTPGRALATLAALVIIWRIVEVNVVLYDESGRPRLPSFATTGILGAPDERAALIAAFNDNPAQVAALLLLARDFEEASRPADAERAYEAAFRLAPLDREVLVTASSFFLRRGKVDEALVLMDRLVEQYPETRERAFPVLAEILAAGRHASTWDRIAGRAPSWIGAFIVSSCRKGVEPEVLLTLFMSRVAISKAQPAETACLVDRLRAAERWEEAYQVWLNTLPRERLANVGSVFNGSFENAPSGVGFDWIPTREPERDVGHSVEVARNSSGAGTHALKVTYNGKRQVGAPIAQYLLLAPGHYEISGLARSDGMRVGRGVQWTVRCVNEGVPGAIVASSERFTGSSEWRRFAFDVDVQASCRGQILQLEPASPSESATYLAGAAWFRDLSATRAP